MPAWNKTCAFAPRPNMECARTELAFQMLLPVTLTQEAVCRYIRQGNEPVGRREAQPRQRSHHATGGAWRSNERTCTAIVCFLFVQNERGQRRLGRFVRGLLALATNSCFISSRLH
ncbi:hypothetical protein J3E68DRAFT_403723 [Trichoderma sp. SZMC 28012]